MKKDWHNLYVYTIFHGNINFRYRISKGFSDSFRDEFIDIKNRNM